MAYEISINGGGRLDLQGLGLSLDSISLVNMQPDQVSLSWWRRSPATRCPVQDDNVVDLFDGNRRLFHGWARLGALSAEGAGIVLLGPWGQLDRYYNQVNAYDGTYAGTLGDPVFTSRMKLFGPSGPAGSVTGATPGLSSYAQMVLILSYLERVAPGVVLPSTQFPLTAATLDYVATLATKRDVQDLRISEAIRQTLAAKPDAAVWWDYGAADSGAARMTIRSADRETARVLRVGKDDGLIGHQLDIKHELRPAGVSVQWEQSLNAITGRGVRMVGDVFPVGVSTFARDVLLQTFDLPNPVAVAQALYASLGVLRSAGTVTVRDLGFLQGWRPGMVLDIQGDGDLDAAGAQHWVQSVTWTAATGVVTLGCGYPPHLSANEVADLRRLCLRMLRGQGGY